jgi:chemotaxis protein methyltransferase CheR
MAFTFFFRDSHTIEKAISFLLPEVAGRQKIKIWDAGCAMGPEPYTFALILAEKMNQYSFRNVHIDATDIDETENFGRTITDGIYPKGDLARMPQDIFEKYFKPVEDTGNFLIDINIRNRVHFRKHDLLTYQPFDFNYNMVICKNVLLHFQYEQRVEVIKMFHQVLQDGGLFFTEQTQPLPEENNVHFEKIATDANVYRKK